MNGMQSKVWFAVFFRFGLAACLAGAGGGRSKLGLHLIAHYTEAARLVVRARPVVLKVLDPQASRAMQAALLDYKKRVPDGITVVRVWEGTGSIHFTLKDVPEEAASAFMGRVLEPALRRLPRAVARCVDFVEGPNEGESCPTWATVATARWYGRFCAALCVRIAGAGFRPCIGAIAVGNPPGSPSEIAARLEAFVPALEAAGRCRGAWSYHAYTLKYTTDPGIESWYSLRYRRFHEYLARRHPALARIPMLLTEAGVDRCGDRLHDGWRARGSREKFTAWLAWFDGQLRQDRYVLGATLFQSGDARGWPSFDVDPAASWLAGHIRNAAAARPPRR